MNEENESVEGKMLLCNGSRMASVLRELGVSFEKPVQQRSYEFTAPAMMPLLVEQWMDDKRFLMSVAHYGKQNGDAMADPDVLYQVHGEELVPLYYQNDYVGVFQRARGVEDGVETVNWRVTQDLLSFTNQWAQNIRATGYKLKVGSESGACVETVLGE